MAEVEWKGLIWRAAYGNFSYKELLTILKGFGSMEIVAFEKPWIYNGIISISLNQNNSRDLTLYYLEVTGPKRCGTGRKALQELKSIFKGKIFVEDPGEILCSEYSIVESLFFWIKMFEDGLIESLESDEIVLVPGATQDYIRDLKNNVEKRLRELLASKQRNEESLRENLQ